MKISKDEGSKRSKMLLLAVTIHNIPEGMAVGVALAGAILSKSGITLAGALTLAMGIALQNLPEGAIVSMPLSAEGKSKPRAFLAGVLSGAVEPLFSVITLLCASLVVPILPFMLSFAAGTMIYVVVQELIPEMQEGTSSRLGIIMLALGFCVMMALDVGLG